MSFRHFSAVTTLKGKLECSDKKCRFSVTKASAPTHSVYAAIKASAGLKPLASYLTAISKGTTKSSSILVRIFITLINFAKSSGERWLRTSSTILREIRSVCRLYFSMIVKMRLLQGGTFTNPKPNMYTFESMTNSKLFLPEFFSNFAYCFNRFFLGHSCKWVAFFRYAFTKLLPQSFSLFYVFIFHKLLPHFYGFSPLFKNTMKLISCQGYFIVRETGGSDSLLKIEYKIWSVSFFNLYKVGLRHKTQLILKCYERLMLGFTHVLPNLHKMKEYS